MSFYVGCVIIILPVIVSLVINVYLVVTQLQDESTATPGSDE